MKEEEDVDGNNNGDEDKADISPLSSLSKMAGTFCTVLGAFLVSAAAIVLIADLTESRNVYSIRDKLRKEEAPPGMFTVDEYGQDEDLGNVNLAGPGINDEGVVDDNSNAIKRRFMDKNKYVLAEVAGPGFDERIEEVPEHLLSIPSPKKGRRPLIQISFGKKRRRTMMRRKKDEILNVKTSKIKLISDKEAEEMLNDPETVVQEYGSNDDDGLTAKDRVFRHHRRQRGRGLSQTLVRGLRNPEDDFPGFDGTDVEESNAGVISGVSGDYDYEGNIDYSNDQATFRSRKSPRHMRLVPIGGGPNGIRLPKGAKIVLAGGGRGHPLQGAGGPIRGFRGQIPPNIRQPFRGRPNPGFRGAPSGFGQGRPGPRPGGGNRGNFVLGNGAVRNGIRGNGGGGFDGGGGHGFGRGGFRRPQQQQQEFDTFSDFGSGVGGGGGGGNPGGFGGNSGDGELDDFGEYGETGPSGPEGSIEDFGRPPPRGRFHNGLRNFDGPGGPVDFKGVGGIINSELEEGGESVQEGFNNNDFRGGGGGGGAGGGYRVEGGAGGDFVDFGGFSGQFGGPDVGGLDGGDFGGVRVEYQGESGGGGLGNGFGQDLFRNFGGGGGGNGANAVGFDYESQGETGGGGEYEEEIQTAPGGNLKLPLTESEFDELYANYKFLLLTNSSVIVDGVNLRTGESVAEDRILSYIPSPTDVDGIYNAGLAAFNFVNGIFSQLDFLQAFSIVAALEARAAYDPTFRGSFPKILERSAWFLPEKQYKLIPRRPEPIFPKLRPVKITPVYPGNLRLKTRGKHTLQFIPPPANNNRPTYEEEIANDPYIIDSPGDYDYEEVSVDAGNGYGVDTGGGGNLKSVGGGDVETGGVIYEDINGPDTVVPNFDDKFIGATLGGRKGSGFISGKPPGFPSLKQIVGSKFGSNVRRRG